MNKNLSFLAAFGLGAVCMYVFDPGGGRRRRALLRDKVTKVTHKTSEGIEAAGRDLSNRATGTIAAARRRFRSNRPTDEVLVEQGGGGDGASADRW